MTDGNRERRAQRTGRMAELMARMRYDPERLAAVKRSMTGMTRCPVCDELNRADRKFCMKCGAYLYPEMRDDDEKKGIAQGKDEIGPEER